MSWFNLIKANTRKEVIELKRYLPNTIAMLVTFYCIFLGLFAGIQLIGDPGSKDLNTQFVIVNYVFWYLALIVVQDIGYQITNEATQGTLEQLYMSPLGQWKIMLSRLIALGTAHFLIVVILLLLAMLTTGQWLNIDLLTILPIFILTIVSMMGLGFIIAGMTLVLKQIGAFLQILQFILAGLVFVPLSTAPFLAFLPIVKGVDLIRATMIDGLSLADFTAFDYFSLIFNAIFYFLLGLIFFLYCERIAMKKGLLAHY
ncbi:ABC transporter permease [Ornithinibacillus sp. FSL M8-0202]|uniref:ABC transporter permease n=1 Tax=Ornithinibacillus sp. FSL M8-0202 TaxID=2921616 RepID=UPI0030D4C21A